MPKLADTSSWIICASLVSICISANMCSGDNSKPDISRDVSRSQTAENYFIYNGDSVMNVDVQSNTEVSSVTASPDKEIERYHEQYDDYHDDPEDIINHPDEIYDFYDD